MKKVSLKELYEGNISGNPELASSGSGDFAHLTPTVDQIQDRSNNGFGSSGGSGGSAG